MELPEFARGPGLEIAVIIFIAGLIWRLTHLFLTARKLDLSEPRQGGAFGGGFRAIFSRFLHHQAFRKRTLTGTVIAYAMHISLAIVIFGSAKPVPSVSSTGCLGSNAK